MFARLTDKQLTPDEPIDEAHAFANRGDTIRGKKYDFILKIMKKVNSTDQADIAIYCQKYGNNDTKKNMGAYT